MTYRYLIAIIGIKNANIADYEEQWDDARVFEIENKLLQGIFGCRQTGSVEAAITYAKFLSSVGITPENKEVAVHASTNRNAFFGNGKQLEDAILPVLLITMHARVEILPRKLNRIVAEPVRIKALKKKQKKQQRLILEAKN